jgi:hypothetical protein
LRARGLRIAVGVVLGSSFWAWIYCFQEVCVVGNFVLVSEKSWVASKRQRDGLHPNWTAPMTMTAPPLDVGGDSHPLPALCVCVCVCVCSL